ncbi:extensin-like [Homalodisca vitripennis]|uniref:extensin-like n=1 Tax=Homalodisca vitripennis TaxID=197043 RepID=UPI001EEA167F|nr:extensin-like [Homalodisca vitripennis]
MPQVQGRAPENTYAAAAKAGKPTPAPAKTQPPKARGCPPPPPPVAEAASPDSSIDSQDEDDGFETVSRRRHRLPRNPKKPWRPLTGEGQGFEAPPHHQLPDNLRGPRSRPQPPSADPDRLLDFAWKCRSQLRPPLFMPPLLRPPLPPPPLPHNPPGTHPRPHSPPPTCIRN